MGAALVQANRMLASQRETLKLMRDALRVRAALLGFHADQSKELRRLSSSAADYYRAHGRYLKAVNRLAIRVDAALIRLTDQGI